MPKKMTLSFSQRLGYTQAPRQLKLNELPDDCRHAIRDLIFRHVRYLPQSLSQWRRASLWGRASVGADWYTVFEHLHTKHFRLPLDEFPRVASELLLQCKQILLRSPFYAVFDLVEGILQHESCPEPFRKEMADLFSHSMLAYRILDDGVPTIVPAASAQEAESLERELKTLQKANLGGAASHLKKAGARIRASDWAGSVRESIHAVESVARQLDPGNSRTLGPALRALKQRGNLHRALESAFSKLYGYTSDKEGIRHALLKKGEAEVDQEEALFMLSACAAFCGYLWRKHRAGGVRVKA